MSMIDRWHSWFRRPAAVDRRAGPRPSPAVEELEKREVLSGFPMAPDLSRFLPSGTGVEARFLAVDTNVPPTTTGNGPGTLAEGTRFIAPGAQDGFLALLRQD